MCYDKAKVINMQQGILFTSQMNEPIRQIACVLRTLDEYVGQQHLVGKGKILRQLIENDLVPSMIFWGPSWSRENYISQDHCPSDESFFY